ncbi:hypothetical protein, partial [Escherichia coli]|uniref:hypothetical protein n=3 Tax=Pseudomonadota TaxID=1224 RepID=UPI002282C7F3
PSSDGAPPGLYFTIVNHRVLESRHKNRLGIYRRALPAVGDIGSAMHIDHYHLKTRHTPATLGAQAFTLCAITAHLAGMDRITLVAADGQAGMQRYVGARVWPKFGFDAPLQDDETAGAGHLAGCSTVQDVMARDETWWDR